MKPLAFDPFHLDVEAFARAGATLEGDRGLSAMARLTQATATDDQPGGQEVAAWKAQGARHKDAGEEAQTWLHLKASARISLTCQRCLKPLVEVLDVSRSFRFVPGEQAAAQLDAELDDDVLATTRSLDLMVLLEDELILGLPLVPRHQRCPQPLLVATDPAGVEAPRENPFAALAAFKPRRKVN